MKNGGKAQFDMGVAEELGYALSQFERDVSNLGSDFAGIKMYFGKLQEAIMANMNGEVMAEECK